MEQHILSLIPDYILGLLPEGDRLGLEQHISQCVGCRLAVERERTIELQIRQTVQVATQPSFARLQALRPAVIPHRPARAAGMMRQLATVMMLLAILAGTLALQTTRVTGGLKFAAPSFYKSNTPTATSTSTPTATIASLTLTAPATTIDTEAVAPSTAIIATLAPRTSGTTAERLPVSTPVAAAPAPVTN